ncbi:MAG TPA: PLD nuclease N-terminal domain-containing protein [Pseudolysinimonas sp.]|nr:PLD nuclease N-terminal domain-containing protein [Pseudolysinimonas sp.]
MRALLPYFGILLAVGFSIFTIIDIALIDRARVKSLPKVLWVIIAMILLVGPLMWFLLGRVRLNPRGGSSRHGMRAPDDDPEFLRKLTRDQAHEERIRDLEQRLREIDDDKPKE